MTRRFAAMGLMAVCECNRGERFVRSENGSGGWWAQRFGCRNDDMPLRDDGIQHQWRRRHGWDEPHLDADDVAIGLAPWLPQPAPFALPGNARREPEELAMCRIAADATAKGNAEPAAALGGRAVDFFEQARAIREQIQPDVEHVRCTYRTFNLKQREFRYLNDFDLAQKKRWARGIQNHAGRWVSTGRSPTRIPAKNVTMQVAMETA